MVKKNLEKKSSPESMKNLKHFFSKRIKELKLFYIEQFNL